MRVLAFALHLLGAKRKEVAALAVTGHSTSSAVLAEQVNEQTHEG